MLNLGLLLQLIILCTILTKTSGHGRLIDPPSRSTMWRYGFNTPHNYNDHELFCGGLSRMVQNGGKCGLCGDAADAAPPRANEVGGKYANGVIVRRYEVNQIIETEVEITAYHKGYFEFKICPTNNPKMDPTQECLDGHTLLLADGKGTKFFPPEPSPGGKYKMKYMLPKWLTCTFCVIQWTYVAGNNWGRCENGTEGIGCGHQETFRACADVAIGDEGNDVETNEISQSSSSPSSSSTKVISSLIPRFIFLIQIGIMFMVLKYETLW